MSSPVIVNGLSDDEVRARSTSAIWQYCADLPHDRWLKKKVKGELVKIWRCSVCKEKKGKNIVKEYVMEKGSTSKAVNHLKSSHNIQINSQGEISIGKTADTVNSITNFTVKKHPLDAVEGQGPNKRARSYGEAPYSPALSRELLGRMIADNNLPIKFARSESFRSFIYSVNPIANKTLPRSDTTIKADLKTALASKKHLIQRDLKSALSKIHLTPDGWTSDNNLGLLGTVGHYVSKDHGLQHVVLGLTEIQGPHSGANMASIIGNLLLDYDIIDKLGYITSDNAKSNDTMMRDLEIQLAAVGVDYDGKEGRIRCNGHIINLVVQAFFFSKHPDAARQHTDEELLGLQIQADDMKKWRKFGPHGKIHNIVVYIESSPQRRKDFKENHGGGTTRRDQKTRWNSWYLMIVWALKDSSKRAIASYLQQEKDLEAESLSRAEWAALTDMSDFLKPFYDATLATESHKHSLDRTLITMDFLLTHLERARVNYGNCSTMNPLVETAWAKMDEYYHKTDDIAVYRAALVLNPSKKFAYFDEHWQQRPEWITRAKQTTRELWAEKYRPSSLITTNNKTVTASSNQMDNSFLDFLSQDLHPTTRVRDELELYLTDALVPSSEFDHYPLTWWLQPAQLKRYPHVYIMAIDIPSIPPMSAEVERLFSEAKHTLAHQRMSMTAETLELLQLNRSFNRHPAITLHHQVSSPLSPILSTTTNTYIEPQHQADYDSGYSGSRRHSKRYYHVRISLTPDHTISGAQSGAGVGGRVRGWARGISILGSRPRKGRFLTRRAVEPSGDGALLTAPFVPSL